jgi:hypothetical protein
VCTGKGWAAWEHSMGVVAKAQLSATPGFVTPRAPPQLQTRESAAMKPASLPTRLRPRPVCQLCDYISQQPAARRAFVSASALKPPPIRRQPVRSHVAIPRNILRSVATTARQLQELQGRDAGSQSLSDRIAALRDDLAQVEAQINAIYESPKIEAEAAILRVLDELEDVARTAIAIRSQQPLPAKTQIRQSSAGALLSGISNSQDAAAKPPQPKFRSKSYGLDALPTPAHLSKLAESFIKHPKVFISPAALTLYIRLQRRLARPHTLPEALYLYANKPVPVEGSSPPTFSKPSPKSARQAIPANLADDALTAAIDAKDISLALAIVDQTYRAPAWRRHRMITKLGLPSALAGMMPFAIYMIAQELSVYSGYIDPWTFKLYAFAGISTYVMCTGTLGFVALTTHNDHHDRVVWRPGVPLLDRYMREDERAALDRIALAWGFKEIWRRGDEEGEDWEGLRQWVLLRGMVLDKPDLMHGMNPGR